MEKPSLEIGNSNWAIKEGELLGYNRVGNDYLPVPITMTRASAGTRVNPEGLVEDVELLGSEEITDGNFPLPNTAWVLSPTFTIADNKLHCVSDGSYQYANQSAMVVGKTYRITFDITGWVSGNIRVRPSGQSPFQTAGSNGSYIFYYTAISNSVLTIERNGTPTDLYIENISVKEATIENLARVDYDGTASSLLVEPMRTNLLTYSEDFTQWDKNSGTTITLDSLISPDGTQNADLIVASGSGSRVGDNVSIVSGNTYTLSVYLKNNGGNTSITIGSYTTTQLETITINDEWNRYTTTFVASSTTTSSIRIISSGSNINLYAWGAQLEESYATSYIPTSGSTVTRNQDVFTRDGIGSLINSTEGVLFVEMAALSDDGTNRSITLSDGSTNNIIQILFSSVSNTIRFIIRVGGVGGDNLDKSTSTYTVTDFNKVALKWKQNDAQVWINGTQLGSPDTNSDVPTGLNDLSFEYLTVGNNFVGKVKQLQVYNTALTDEQLLQLTGTSGTDFYESYAEMASALTYTIQ